MGDAECISCGEYIDVCPTTAADDYETQPEKPPVGTAVGNTCPTIVLDLIGSDENFSVEENADGVITDYFVGGLMQDELVVAVERALGNE